MNPTFRRYLSCILLVIVGLWGLFIGGTERKVGLVALIVGLCAAYALRRHELNVQKKIREWDQRQKNREEKQ